jgi:hypothetical protein
MSYLDIKFVQINSKNKHKIFFSYNI